jgi:hypothetical protein
MGWMLCDTPVMLSLMLRLGVSGQDSSVRRAAQHLASLVSDNGWRCVVSAAMGKFRGPGRKDDPCPYATLVCLKALSLLAGWRDSLACRTGALSILDLWEKRRERRPYLFAMGTDFCKLKAPLIWYDIGHVVEVLSRFPWLRDDARLQDMAGVIRGASDESGRFAPQSVWQAWKGWDFGQKREPSRWLTLVLWRALRRFG